MLLVRDGRHQQPAPREAPAHRDLRRRVDHGRHAALHVLAAAPVEAAVPQDGLEGRGHPFDAHRVRVAAEHQRPTGLPALDYGNDVRPPRCDLGDLDVDAGRRERRGDSIRNARLPGAAGHERRVDGVDRDQVAQ